ncbi:hypothetical protein TKK_0008209 [Trichogramma kaykai]
MYTLFFLVSVKLMNNVESANDIRFVDESLDEQNDAQIYKAVVDSMNEWQLKTQRKGRHSRRRREVSRVCYEDVGCFEDTGPFSYLEMLPSPPKDVGTRFYVYGSRKARSIPMEVPAENISEKAGHTIDPKLPTKVIVHGFGSSCDHVWVYEMRAALTAVVECNIVCVDWGPGSAVPNYVRAAANTRLVGRQLAKLVRSLNVPLDKVHLIGFSLGAHVAGFAGAELGNVSRITGLDPAGPLFEAQDPRARLDASDAKFVDVIHSNGEQLILGGLGSWQPMGHVDFYPNGGRMQSGCTNLFVGAVSDIIWSSPVEGRSLCNHRRAYKFFTDSISPKCHFPAFPCEGGYDALLKGECFPCGTESKECGIMGYYADESAARGQLYLMTRDEEPFCAHQYQVKVYNSKHERPVKSYGRLQVTLLSDSAINETFTMTKKDDEELLVSAILQKIVVPHPALMNIDALEIKYTAYSGWIQSGLVSWSVDKVSLTDPHNNVLSICKRGLILESGKPVYLPLFKGDCSVPPEIENMTVAPLLAKDEMVQAPQSIGPFTKEHNYDRNHDGGFTNEVPQKSLGPFTKDQNIKIANEKAKDYDSDESEKQKHVKDATNSWSFHFDIPNGGAANSADVGEFVERGRGFSGLGAPLSLHQIPPVVSLVSSSSLSDQANPKEMHEPLIRSSGNHKKEPAGRSLRLPEITEPLLKAKNSRSDAQQDVTEESPSSREFTIQFLPERIAGILAQAEKYARMTLLPLISQYTPSFIGGARNDKPKYFPPLGNIFGTREPDDEDSSEEKRRKKLLSSKDSRTKYYYEFEETVTPKASSSTTGTSSSTDSSSSTLSPESGRSIVYAVASTTPGVPSSTNESREKNGSNEWVPIPVMMPAAHITVGVEAATGRKQKSLEGEWVSESGTNWSPRSNDTNLPVPETKIDDWTSLAVAPLDSASSTSTTIINDSSAGAEVTMPTEQQRKFIPLLEFTESVTDSPKSTDTDGELRTSSRNLVNSYVYGTKNDPRTKYIPLVAEEDMGTFTASIVRDTR